MFITVVNAQRYSDLSTVVDSTSFLYMTFKPSFNTVSADRFQLAFEFYNRSNINNSDSVSQKKSLFILPENWLLHRPHYYRIVKVYKTDYISDIRVDTTSFVYYSVISHRVDNDSLTGYVFNKADSSSKCILKFYGVHADMVKIENPLPVSHYIKIDRSRVNIPYNQLIIIFFTIAAVTVIFCKIYQSQYFSRSIQSILFKTSFDNFTSERNIMADKSGKMLLINYFINISIFAYVICCEYSYFLNNNFWLLIFSAAAIVTGYYVAKFIIVSILSYLFDVSDLCRLYYRYNGFVMQVTGAILLPLNFCLIYVDVVSFHKTFLLIALVIFVLALMLKFYKLFSISLVKQFSVIYIFLYLCSVEILPVLTIWKFVNP